MYHVGGREGTNLPFSGLLLPWFGKLDSSFKNCGLGLSQCSAKHPCPIHDEYKEIRDSIEKLFKEKNVLSLCEPVNSGQAYLMG